MNSEIKNINIEKTKINYNRAIEMLKQNIVRFECYDKPVLTTGKGYPGIWLEHNHDSLFYSEIEPEISINSHRIFYDFQAEDGLFPAYICKWEHEEAYRIGYGHMQTVYPIAASAYEIAKKTGDEKFLTDSYKACIMYDNWIRKNRNTRKTGLVEMFCGFDTGHDNSSRLDNINNVCPKGNARICCENPGLPIIAPDLSAMLYRSEVALADMAGELGYVNERESWIEKANIVKENLYKICYDKQDDFFYDVDCNDKFRKYKSELIFRMFVNRAVDKDIFDKIFDKYIVNPKHFFCEYPFPSMAVSDPGFNIELKENNWNGKTQTHTALETLFWMEYYGKNDLVKKYMTMWVNLCNDSDMICSQEIDPFTGKFSTKAPAFTTTLIMYIEFVKRLGMVK